MLRQHSLKEQASKLEFDVFVVDQLIHQILDDVGSAMMLETGHGYRREIGHMSASVLAVHVDRQFDRQCAVIIFLHVIEAEITTVHERFQTGRLVVTRDQFADIEHIGIHIERTFRLVQIAQMEIRDGIALCHNVQIADSVFEYIVTGTAGQNVVTLAADQHIVAAATEQNIMTFAAIQVIVSTHTYQNVVTCSTVEMVIAVMAAFDVHIFNTACEMTDLPP